MYSHLAAYPGDPILGLVSAFMADSRPHKANLAIGYYYDAAGQLPTLECMKMAAQQVTATPGYLPMDGLAAFRKGVQRLLFGSANDCIATVQTLGGSGGLSLAAELLKRAYPESQVWVSNPTWDNHLAIFKGAGFQIGTYPYLDASNSLDLGALLSHLNTLPAHHVVLLQPCGHNPTGVDPDPVGWRAIIETCVNRDLVMVMDMAYHGFVDSLPSDAWPVRHALDCGGKLLVINSFSKNFSAYGDRVGALSVVCSSPAEADRVQGVLKSIVRSQYSSPPSYGAVLISTVLEHPKLCSLWEEELGRMRARILEMRRRLHERLCALAPQHDHDYLLKQSGMFSFTGLSHEQVVSLRQEHAVYLLESGRLCLPGLNDSNVDRVSSAISQVLTD